jgi:HPt (histidine-containing phosphotransfer) domain-containing protein
MYRGGEPALLDADAPDVVARWRELCHSLRAACATVGATELADQLRDFEDELAATPGDPGRHAARARHLHEALADLAGRLGGELGL